MKSLVLALVFLLSTHGFSREENNMSVGYQIGGITLLGLDYEVRLDEVFGIHAGGGIKGFNAGIRTHFGDKIQSPFLDLSYRDGGFGLINVLALHYGGTIMANKSSGVRLEIGLYKLLSIDGDFSIKLYKSKEPPPYGLLIGMGLAW